MENLTLNQHLCFAMYSTWSVINRMYKPILEELDLTYTQYIVLTVLWEKESQTVKQLGDTLFLGSNTLTPVLKRLESKKLIQRVRDNSDDRIVHIILSEKGRKMSARAIDVPYCIPEITNLPIEHLSALKGQIQELRELLNA